MKSSKLILDILICCFILLFGYAGANKIIYFQSNLSAMHKQPFSYGMASFLSYAVPASEIIIVLLLLFPKTKKIGLYAFTLEIGAFSIYIGLILSRVYKYIPCSCGGIFKEMGWTSHLIMNLIFFLGGILAIILNSKERSENLTIKRVQII